MYIYNQINQIMSASNNYTETSRTINSGFLLNEQEFRRLIEIIIEQFEKIEDKSTPDFKFIIKNFNGFVIETHDLDFILKMENDGSSQIIDLEINSVSKSLQNTIIILFSNNFSDRTKEDKSIRYSIKSENRDWAMISSSLIDDRLNKININNKAFTFTRRLLLSLTTLLMIGMLTYLMFNLNSIETKNVNTLKVLKNLEFKLNHNENINFVKALIEVERSKINNNQDIAFFGKTKYFMWVIIPFLFIMTFFDSVKKIIIKYFPNRIFYWGDYIDKYDKIIKRRNIFIGFVFITLFISIVVNLFSNFLWAQIVK
ncbi:hypothetical protein SAMN05443292_0397 [Halpernia frigidisoli]|uniref:Uncharacterized protein n=2 Tax=Halpernia frigidisoli TaxID=1125876 RepID=A0A1I3DE16_9FLAO|nr:hypothetical protein SAMN05443292_0397 [Halpernia frigidisoli]